MKDSEPADKATWNVASPPPPLRPAVADELLAAWRGTKRVVSAEPLTGGLMNWNYSIRLSGTAERFVVRFYNRAPDACAKDVLFRQRVDASLLTRMLHLARSHEDGRPAANAGFSLVHGDFNSPNIFVRHDRGAWRVAAILDWEFAFAGPMLCDIGNMLRYERPSQPRYEPHFSRGLLDGGWRAPNDWFLRARLADLPALCELLTRDDVPEAIVIELRDLLEGTCAY